MRRHRISYRDYAGRVTEVEVLWLVFEFRQGHHDKFTRKGVGVLVLGYIDRLLDISKGSGVAVSNLPDFLQ